MQISVATSATGNLCKSYPGGKRGIFSKGHLDVVAFTSLKGLGEIIKGLNYDQCIIMGYPNGSQPGDRIDIGTKGKLKSWEIARIKDNFEQSEATLCDYDFAVAFRCRRASDVHRYLCQLLPEVFEGAGYIARKSSRSRVLKNGEPLKNHVSWHLYYLADDPFKTKWLADNLMKAAVLKGLDYFKRSKDGKNLLRTVIDLQPLKVGASGISYEAAPIVSGEYTLADSRLVHAIGGKVRTSIIGPVTADKPQISKSKSCDHPLLYKPYDFFALSAQVLFSDEYKNLNQRQQMLLQFIGVQQKGYRGTIKEPIICTYDQMNEHLPTAPRSRRKKDIEALEKAGFIAMATSRNRVANRYYLNYNKLCLSNRKIPEDWSWKATVQHAKGSLNG